MQPSPVDAPRSERRKRILALLAANPVPSQASLQSLLAGEGMDVNQATLSRDLRALGVFKGPAGYELPPSAATPEAPEARLRQAVRQWLRSATPAQNLIVLRTPPGGAQPLGLALDADPPSGVVGTVAGDDTVLVIGADARAARRVARALEELLS